MSWLLFDLNGTLLDPGDKLRDLEKAVTLSMAETLSGGYRPFSEFIPDPPEPKVFADVRPGLEALSERFQLAVLTNSPRDDALSKIEATGIAELFELVVSADEVKAFKPDPRVYALGLERAGTQDAWMVAAHAWDLLGASRAGMKTAYLARTEPWPEALDSPTAQAPDLTALAGVIG